MSLSFGKTIKKLSGWDEDILAHKRNFANMVCDGLGGLLLSRMVYWHDDATGGKDPGQTRLRVKKAGHLWIARANGEWFEETAATSSQVELFFQKWRELGLIEVHQWLFNNRRINHVRIVEEVFVPLWEFSLAHPPSPECFNIRTNNGKAAFSKWWSMAETAILEWQKQASHEAGDSHGDGPETATPTTGVTPLATPLATTPLGASAVFGVDVDSSKEEKGDPFTRMVEKLLTVGEDLKLPMSYGEAATIAFEWPAAQATDDDIYDQLTKGPLPYGFSELIKPNGKVDMARAMLNQDAEHLRFLLCTWHLFDQANDATRAKKNITHPKTACFITQFKKRSLPPGDWLKASLAAIREAREARNKAERDAVAQERQKQFEELRASLSPAQEVLLGQLVTAHIAEHFQGSGHWSTAQIQRCEALLLMDEETREQILSFAGEGEALVEEWTIEDAPEGVSSAVADGAQLNLEMGQGAAQLRDVNAGLDVPERGLPSHLGRYARALLLDGGGGMDALDLDEQLAGFDLSDADRQLVRDHVVEQVPAMGKMREPVGERRKKLERFADMMVSDMVNDEKTLEWVDEELTRFPAERRERLWMAERIVAEVNKQFAALASAA
jgi:hypothetical protein